MGNYVFDITIPASGHNPSTDQPIMLANNVSDASIWAQDHVGYNADNGGLHKQVTFTANQSAPGFGSGVSDLFANLSSSISQLFFQNSTTTFQLTGLPLVTSGTDYGIVTPWGLTINFGNHSSSSGGSTTVTYAIALGALYYWSASANNTSGGIIANTNTPTTTTMGVTCTNTNGSLVSKLFTYLVIGRSV